MNTKPDHRILRTTQNWLAAVVLFFLAGTGQAQNPPRPNAFLIQPNQAGSTVDIDNLRVVDLDSGLVVYTNGFSEDADATNKLSLYYWPLGESGTTNYVLNGPMTRLLNGKLRLETTGFGNNGAGGYNSHCEAEYADALPRNFLVDFEITKLQYNGHYYFRVFYRQPTDALCSYGPGGAFSADRSPARRLDYAEIWGEGDWFRGNGYVTNNAYAIQFPAPAGNPRVPLRIGFSLSNQVATFYIGGSAVNSTNLGAWISDERMSLIRSNNTARPSFSGLASDVSYQLEVSTNIGSWTDYGAPFAATNDCMPFCESWNVDGYKQMFFRIRRQ